VHLLMLITLLANAGPLRAGPRLDVALLASRTSIAPGETVDLVVQVDVPEPWHVYHPILLDTGLPTTIELSDPEGVTFGRLRFPRPTLDATASADIRIEYLELKGRFYVLTTVSLDESFRPGTSLKIRADVNALACIQQCVPVQASGTLTLPVTAEPGKSANAKAFAEAREALPPMLSRAPYIEGSRIRVEPERVGLNQRAEVIATIRVKANHHVLARDPGVEGLIPSRLFIESRDGIEFAEPEDWKWDAPRSRLLPGVGRVQEYSGTFEVRVPFVVTDPQFPSGPVTLRALFQYQCCTDTGQCFPPEMAAATLHFVVDSPNRRAASSAAPEQAQSATPATAPAAAQTPPTDEDGAAAAEEPSSGGVNLGVALLLAFLGGLILNVMPCVLPVISIKILSFVQQGGEDPGRVLRLGLTFCAGILVWFWLFAFLSMTGRLPLQYPPVVIGVGTVLLLLALNLFGVFELTLPGAAAGRLDEFTRREGYPGAFFKGFLATLLGTACTAPFLAGALVFAATQPRTVAFLVFTAAGLGMALPYLLLSANPAWLRYVPRPGPWMITFKQSMGFVLVGTNIWLLLVLGDQLGADGVVWTVAFWSFLGLSAWLYGRIRPTWGPVRRWITVAAALLVAADGLLFCYDYMYDLRAALQPGAAAARKSRMAPDVDPAQIVAAVEQAGWDDHIPWMPYRPGLAQELSRRGYTVYVDYTATWCATCLSNKATSLEIDRTRRLMKELGVIPLKADLTSKDRALLEEVKSYGRNSVPLNLIYPAGRPDDVIVLPVILTPSRVLDALAKAGPSQPVQRVTRKDRP